MEFFLVFINVLSIIIGYLIGSILPAYILGRLKGFDIREKGTRNPGTSNVRFVIGFKYSVLTGVFDTLKGIFAILLALALGADFIFAQLSGFAAIIGHIFPFYIRFRGGQGVATATGIMLLYLFTQYLVTIEFFLIICFLIVIYLIFFSASRVKKSMPMVFTLPVYGYAIYLHYPDNPFNIFCWIILAFLFSFGVYSIITLKLIKIEDERFKSHWWRVALRPVAILFIVFYFIYTQLTALLIIGIVALCFIFLDIFRFINKQTNELLTQRIKTIFKKSEEKKFSSMTIFLVAGFIAMLLFERNIAVAAFSFLTFCDIFSKIFGLSFGKYKIFDKTLEGSLAYIGCALICGYFISNLLDMPFIILILGGISAALAEVFSFRIDDNFTVALISGSVMTAIMFFLTLI